LNYLALKHLHISFAALHGGFLLARSL